MASGEKRRIGGKVVYIRKAKKASPPPPPKAFSDHYDAEAFFGVGQQAGMFPDWNNAISAEQRDAVVKYTGSAFTSINGHLRKGTLGTNQYYGEIVKNMDAALAKSELKQPITVMRGSSASLLGGYNTVEDIQKYVVGQTVKDLGYTSTSADSQAAFGGAITYKINIPAGKGKGMYVAPISKYKDEGEFLLPRGTSFKVSGVTSQNGKPLVTLDVV